MVIYDLFLIHNEVDLLVARMAEMASVPDVVHIACEGTTTHRGAEKPLYIADWCDEHGHPPRLTLLDTDLPQTGNPWDAERYQRESLLELLVQKFNPHSDDLILSCDVDEIVRGEAIPRILHATKQQIISLQMRHHVYDLGWYDAEPWVHAKAFRWNTWNGKDLSDIRPMDLPSIPECGWHLSWFGGREAVEQKLRSFAHSELDTDMVRRSIPNSMDNGKTLNGIKLHAWLGGDFPATMDYTVHVSERDL